VRAERRQAVPAALLGLLAAADRAGLDGPGRARRRSVNLRAVLETHTVWEHPDGRDLCDFDGDLWPCHTVSALAFVLDTPLGDPPRTAAPSAP
jgi:hypothetical protein